MGGAGGVDPAVPRSMGLHQLRHLPPSFAGKLAAQAIPYLLSAAHRHGLDIAECREAPPGLNACYLGVHFLPTAGKRGGKMREFFARG